MEKPPGVGQSTTFLNNIPLVELPQKEIVSFAKKIFNGSSKDLIFRVESDLDRCQKLWEEFSTRESLFDLWDFRLAFWRGHKFSPYFITLSFQEKVLSVLPLWFDGEDQQYTWFGSSWPEDNFFFTKRIDTIPLLLKLVPSKARLFCIRSQEGITDQPGLLEKDEEKYVLDVKNFNSMDNFWNLLKKKKRYNLKRDWKRIQALNRFRHVVTALARLGPPALHGGAKALVRQFSTLASRVVQASRPALASPKGSKFKVGGGR